MVPTGPYVTESFELPRAVYKDLAERPVKWGFGAFSEAVYYRTYSRQKDDGTQERWHNTIIRAVEGNAAIRKTHYKLHGIPWDEQYWQFIYTNMAYHMFDFHLLPPGRGLYSSGTQHVADQGAASLQNCGYTEVEILSDDAAWCMDMLMLGVGIGFSTEPKRHQRMFEPEAVVRPSYTEEVRNMIYDLALNLKAERDYGNISQDEYDAEVEKLKREYDDKYGFFIVPDTREGWVESVRRLIQAFETGDYLPLFIYDFIRPSGEPIGRFGGLSSGPSPLQNLHFRLTETLLNYVSEALDQTQMITDVFNLIGCCVVAGNVRRSAELAVGSIYDDTFLNLKNYEQYPNRQAHGWMSNNSVVLRDSDDFYYLPQIANRIRDNGEPGIINLINVQKYGRYGKKKIDLATGFNPCAEQPLEDKELCCLVEVFPTRCKDENELEAAVWYATLYAQTVSLLPTHDVKTNLVMAKNRRIGVSMSGIADWIDGTSLSHVHGSLDRLYEDVAIPASERFAEQARVPAPVRVTTVKPSGTISKLAGVSAGMHYPTFRWGIRRMRVSEGSPLVDVLTAAGVPYEEDAYSDNTLVFEFPLEMGAGKTRSVDEVSIWEQASMVAFLQRVWSDNAVSNTLTFSPDREGDQIERVIAAFAPLVKSMSLLPDQSEQQSYVQAPEERITREEYRERRRQMKDIDWSAFGGSDGEDIRFCDGEVCEI